MNNLNLSEANNMVLSDENRYKNLIENARRSIRPIDAYQYYLQIIRSNLDSYITPEDNKFFTNLERKIDAVRFNSTHMTYTVKDLMDYGVYNNDMEID